MKNTRTINLTYDWESFEKLKQEKDNHDERLNWEEFVFNRVMRRDKHPKVIK